MPCVYIKQVPFYTIMNAYSGFQQLGKLSVENDTEFHVVLLDQMASWHDVWFQVLSLSQDQGYVLLP